LSGRDGSEIPVIVHAQKILFQGKPADAVILIDITDRKLAEQAILHRLEFEETVSKISSSFVGVLDVDTAINASLADIGRLSRASRSYLFLFRDNGTIMDNTHEWCAEGVSRQINNLQNLSTDKFPWWMTKLRKGEIIQIENASKMPVEVRTERKILLEDQDIRSLLVLPLNIGGELAGFIGFDNVIGTGRWSDSDLALLRVCSKIIGDALERKRVEAELRNSERRFRDVSENALEWIWEVDSKGKYVYASPVVEKILGYKQEEVLGKHFYDFFHPDDREELKSAAFEVFAEKKAFRDFVNRNMHKNGKTVWLSTSGSPILDEKGSLLGYRGADTDITERERMEDALRRERKRLYSLLEELPAPICLVAPDYSIRFSNRIFREHYGDSKADPCYELLHGRSQPCDDCMTFRVFDTGKPQEWEHTRVDGRIHRIYDYPFTDVDGSSLVLEVSFDMTETKRMEDALREQSKHLEELVEERSRELRESEEKFRTIYDNAIDGIHLVSVEDKKFFDGNKAFCEMIGHSRKELRDIGVLDIHPKNSLPYVLEQFERAAKKEITLAKDIPVKRRDGSIFYVDVGASPTTLGGKTYLVGVFRDITERKRMEQRLLQSERMAAIGEAAAMVGHDLRNPLQVMVNRLFLANKAVKNLAFPYSEVATKLGLEGLFNDLREQMEYMNKIVSNLQDYARPIRPEPVETSLNQLLDDTFSTITVPETVKASRIIDKNFPKLKIDPTLMRRVFANLVTNAIQAMPNRGKLTIRASETEDAALISIQDTGVGIPQENMNKIFVPLFTTKSKGAGFGLPVSKRLVEAHDGTITVESKMGEGSTFTVRLPLRKR